MPRSLHRQAKSTRGWGRVKPIGKYVRLGLKRRCGCRAFLDCKARKYPIMAARGCRVDCRGLRSAKQRASQYGRRNLVAKADRLARLHGCRWAKRER